jgi:Flp pilus assembly protein TadG
MNADKPSAMTRAPRGRSRVFSRQRGTALIEFTLVLPLLLILTVAAVDFGRAFFVKNMLHQAAREGVRMMAVHANPDSVDARAREVAGASGITLTNVQQQAFGSGEQAQVVLTVQADFNWSFPGVFNLFGAGMTNPTTLTAKAVMHEE